MSKTTWSGPYPVAEGLETWDRMEQEEEWETWLFMLLATGRCAWSAIQGMPVESIS